MHMIISDRSADISESAGFRPSFSSFSIISPIFFVLRHVDMHYLSDSSLSLIVFAYLPLDFARERSDSKSF